MKILTTAYFLFIGCCSILEIQCINLKYPFNCKPTENNVFELTNTANGIKHISQLKEKNGQIIGDLIVNEIGTDIFNDLFVINKNHEQSDTIYSIIGTTFKNKKGIDFTFSNEDFFGYRFVLIKDDYFEIIFLSKGGTIESDILTIKYNTKEKLFEVLKTL